MKQLILASASPRRKELLTQVGIFADVVPSEVEEKITKTLPAEVVEELSRQKCLDVAGRMAEDCMVLGADTVVAAEGRILGKPGTLKRAEEMLQRLQGRTHQVYIGVTLAEVKAGRIVRAETFSSCTSVTVCPMTDEEIAEYARSGEPLDKAGAYGIQGVFAKFVEKIEGDYNNVVGLPVAAVYQRLRGWPS